ncbi:MAG: hypothetical protein ACRDOE_01395 [Streptosporangiaceae bacterium]
MDVNTFLSHRRPVATPSGEIACTESGAGPAALFVHGLGTSGAQPRRHVPRSPASNDSPRRCKCPTGPSTTTATARPNPRPRLADHLADHQAISPDLGHPGVAICCVSLG